MKIAITGICGFVGSSLARHLLERMDGLTILGIDNLVRPGSEQSRAWLDPLGVQVFHGDVRMASDLDLLPGADWVIDAAANPSVLAGVDGRTSLRQLMEHNLVGTLNVLEYCRRSNAGLMLLSSSRVYSIPALASLPMRPVGQGQAQALALDASQPLPCGVSPAGISEQFSTAAPVSPYGGTKLASEIVAMEYGAACGFPVWVNRCGVMAGAGQFGTAEQGIFSYWLHAHAARRPLRYIGFEGKGLQVRDAFHPQDLAALLHIQMKRPSAPVNPVYNVSGGTQNSMSLAQLTSWCNQRFGPHTPMPDLQPRPFDIPWLVLDAGLAHRDFGWTPARTLTSILDEIAVHVKDNPGWLERCGVK
jgi:CDP-paratose 2-epimerase